MNSFADPEQAIPFTFPEFPAEEGKHLDFSSSEYASNSFKDFEHAKAELKEVPLPVVQPVLLQDFKQVLASSRS